MPNHKKSGLSLEEMGKIMFPLVQILLSEYKVVSINEYIKLNGIEETPLLLEHDFIGIYILLFLSLKTSNHWHNGMLPTPIHPFSSTSISMKLCTLPNSFHTFINLNFIAKKLQIPFDEVTIIDVYNRFQLKGMKCNKDNFIQSQLVHWSLNLRPYCLSYVIPSPYTVLTQQAEGKRVLTAFIQLDELCQLHNSQLYYMSTLGDPFGAGDNAMIYKDAMEFIIHDLKHMEHFMHKDTYNEQIGFFASMSQLNDRKKLKKYFIETLGYDLKLWNELEYVIADM